MVKTNKGITKMKILKCPTLDAFMKERVVECALCSF